MSEVESAATELKTQYAAQVAGDLERNITEQERIGAEVAALEEQLRALRHDQTLLAELQRALGGDSSARDGASTGKGAAKGAAPAPSVPRQASAATTAGRRRRTAATKAAAKPASAKSAAKPAGGTAERKTAAEAAGSRTTDAKTAGSRTAGSGTTGSRTTGSTAASRAAASGSAAAQSAGSASAPAGTASAKSAARPTLVELIREHLGRQSEPRSSAEVATALATAHPDREIKPKVVRTTVEGLVARGEVRRAKQGSSVFYTASGAAPAAADTAGGAVTEQAPESA